MSSRTVLYLFFSGLLVAAASSQKCYGLNGTELDSTYGACNPGAKHSGCCAINRPAGAADICLDNGLCMATQGEYMGTIWQDGCTDPTGKDEDCPKLCPGPSNNFDNFAPVVAWNVQMCDYGSYCCRAVNDRNNCCNNATAPKVRTNNIGKFQFRASTAGAAPTDTNSPFAFGTAVSTGVPFPSSTTTPDSSDELPAYPKDKSAVVGGAVGGVLGATILVLTFLIAWMHKKEKRQRKLKEHYEEQFGQNWAYRRTVVVESDAKSIRIERPFDERPFELDADGDSKMGLASRDSSLGSTARA